MSYHLYKYLLKNIVYHYTFWFEHFILNTFNKLLLTILKKPKSKVNNLIKLYKQILLLWSVKKVEIKNCCKIFKFTETITLYESLTYANGFLSKKLLRWYFLNLFLSVSVYFLFLICIWLINRLHLIYFVNLSLDFV